jgi:hypothetical protein
MIVFESQSGFNARFRWENTGEGGIRTRGTL